MYLSFPRFLYRETYVMPVWTKRSEAQSFSSCPVHYFGKWSPDEGIAQSLSHARVALQQRRFGIDEASCFISGVEGTLARLKALDPAHKPVPLVILPHYLARQMFKTVDCRDSFKRTLPQSAA